MLTKLLLIVIVQSAWCQREPAKRCARAASSCLLAPETTEGPYYWNSTVRRDIREGRTGISLRLKLTVLDTRSCSPISNAVVDLWHCDSVGIYSHYIAASLGQMDGKPDNTTFFRGQQITDSEGAAIFDTIYPGWYRGRATHMHVKVHIGANWKNIGGAIYTDGGHVSHTGQIYFDDSLTDAISTLAPYSSHTIRRTRNDEDEIFGESIGPTMIVPTQFLTDKFFGGATGEITVGIDPTAIPLPVDDLPPPGPPSRPSSGPPSRPSSGPPSRPPSRPFSGPPSRSSPRPTPPGR